MRREAEAPNRRGADAEATDADASVQRKAFQGNAAREHAVERVLRDADAAQGELLEARKLRGRGQRGELAAAELGRAERRREAERGRRHRVACAPVHSGVGDFEILKAGERPGAEPAVDLAWREGPAEREPAGGAGVVGEDPGDDGDVLAGVARAEAAVDRQVERRRGRAPEGAPPAREDLRARAVLGGEERDDGAEDVVGEVADEIVGASLLLPGAGDRKSVV